MKNFIQKGDTLTVTAPGGGVSSGDGVQIGSLFGVAAFDAEAGDPVEITVEGVFELPKASADDLTAGAPVYWDGAEAVDTQGTADIQIGLAVAAAGAGATTVNVKLTPGAA